MSHLTTSRCHRSFTARHPMQNTFVLYGLAYPGCMCGTLARREACLNRMLTACSELVTVPSRTCQPGIEILRRYSGTVFGTLRLIPTSMTWSHANHSTVQKRTGIHMQRVVSELTPRQVACLQPDAVVVRNIHKQDNTDKTLT